MLLCERHCVPLRPRWPPVPPTSHALPPLCALPVYPPVLPLFFFLRSRSLLLLRPLRVTSALLRVTLVPLPGAPSLACLPSHSPSRIRPCVHVYPPCPCIAVTRVCHSCALPLPLPLAPTLSPGCSLSPRLSPHPACLAPCVGGGGSIGQVCTRHCAPAAPGSRPSSPTQIHDCPCHAHSWSLPSSLDGIRVGLLLQGSGHCRLRTEVRA